MSNDSVVQFHDINENPLVLDLTDVDSVVFNADCMELLRVLPDKCIDLAIVDPPYGITAPKGTYLSRAPGRGNCPSTAELVRKRAGSLKGSGKLKNRVLNISDTDWDNTPPQKEYFDELFRVSRNQIIWGGNYFDLPPTRCFVVWDKRQPWPNFSQAEYAWTSYSMPSKVFAMSNCIKGRIHPTQKPVELYEFLLNTFARSGDLILDTHLGSGSSRIAAVNMGYRFIGCEKNEHFYQEEERRWNCMTTEIEKERNKEQMVLF